MEESDGKEVVYLFAGNALGRSGSDGIALSGAALWWALALEPGEYSRAHVGLAGGAISSRRCMRVAGHSNSIAV